MQHNDTPKLKFIDGTDVPADVKIEIRGREHLVINPDNTQTQVFTNSALKKRRLKFADGTDVPDNAQVEIRKRCYFVINPDNSQTQVFTNNALKRKSLKFVDGTDVPANAQVEIRERKYFVINSDNTQIQVFTIAALEKKRAKFKEDTNAPANAQVETSPDNTQTEAFSINTPNKRKSTEQSTTPNKKQRIENNSANHLDDLFSEELNDPLNNLADLFTDELNDHLNNLADLFSEETNDYSNHLEDLSTEEKRGSDTPDDSIPEPTILDPQMNSNQDLATSLPDIFNEIWNELIQQEDVEATSTSTSFSHRFFNLNHVKSPTQSSPTISKNNEDGISDNLNKLLKNY